MSRLDRWLIDNEYFSSRQAAKRAIRNGLVQVIGRETKPSTKVRSDDEVQVSCSATECPQGFHKLREINEKFCNRIIQSNAQVLDVGSSAGGFLLYIAKQDAYALGIEVSQRFQNNLVKIAQENPRVAVLFDDAFRIDPAILFHNEEIDVLIVDVTTDLKGTMELISRFTRLLKSAGWLIAAFKTELEPNKRNELSHLVHEVGYKTVETLVLDIEKKEIHVVARRE